jgi:hypothetical protein
MVVLPVMVSVNSALPADDIRGMQGTCSIDLCMGNIFRDAPGKVNPEPRA